MLCGVVPLVCKRVPCPCACACVCVCVWTQVDYLMLLVTMFNKWKHDVADENFKRMARSHELRAEIDTLKLMLSKVNDENLCNRCREAHRVTRDICAEPLHDSGHA